MLSRHTPSDCLRPPLQETLPTKCQQLQRGYADCKRGLIDMRKRFRGNRPIGVSTELEGSGEGGATVNGGDAYMLYAGKANLGVRVTDGNEGVPGEYGVPDRGDGGEKN
ncbi:hypothetical protein K432DRAFT_386192 [Lepidopterella palustris CBS 459.81]|uniref:Cytochrome c oxidase assembly protein n=1 Tax=Lepidopterella palustris CBS 459.81 TaxID=1314670 RepID=A0A8E2E172_9PEZI|nr:hypothetical protein K432DRAFT_386192 [Lepidopterella palustris CBS 459.81]